MDATFLWFTAAVVAWAGTRVYDSARYRRLAGKYELALAELEWFSTREAERLEAEAETTIERAFREKRAVFVDRQIAPMPAAHVKMGQTGSVSHHEDRVVLVLPAVRGHRHRIIAGHLACGCTWDLVTPLGVQANGQAEEASQG